MSSCIYESLPPMVVGLPIGRISIKTRMLKMKDATFPVKYTLRFEWWGQKAAAVTLNCPWKAGMTEDEAIFPLRAERSVIEEYFTDMSELQLEVLDKSGKPIGKAILSLDPIIKNELQFDEKITIYSIKSPKKAIAELSLAIATSFDSSPLEDPIHQQSKTLQLMQQDSTPQRAEKTPVAAESTFGVSSFQRNEALAMTDFSNRFADWPTGGGGALAPGSSSSGARNMVSKKFVLASAIADPVQAPALAPAPIPVRPTLAPSVKKKSAAAASGADQPRSSKEYDPAYYAFPELENKVPVEEPASVDAAPAVPRTVDSLLQRAESLLKMVQKSSKTNSTPPSIFSEAGGTLPLPEHKKGSGRMGYGMAGVPSQRLWSLPQPVSKGNSDISEPSAISGPTPSFNVTHDPSHDLTQIEWLLRGLPDAYNDEPEYSDEAITQIIKQGGPPPSALMYPSLYSANQRIMDKLKTSRTLRVSLEHLLVYSARFGLRRDSSHAIIRPPIGTKVASSSSSVSNTRAVFVPLPELDDEVDQPVYCDTAGRRKANKGLAKDFFVGGIDLHHTHSFSIELTDAVIKSWMEGKRDGCVVIELHGYIFPPSTTAKGHAYSEPVLFGTVTVPLSGLLLVDSLDAIVTTEIDVEQSTLASVLGRMQALPGGHVLLKQKPLGLKMGSVRLRLSLMNDKAVANHTEPTPALNLDQNQLQNKKKTAPLKTGLMIEPVLSTAVESERVDAARLVPDTLHAAMQYHPTEPPASIKEAVGPITASIAIAVFSMTDLQLTADCAGIESVAVQYKPPQRSAPTGTPSKVTLTSPLVRSAAESPSITLQPSLQLFDIDDLRAWKPPIFEVWANNVTAGKKLLGLAKVPPNAKLNDILSLPVTNLVNKDDDVATLFVALFAHTSRGYVEEMGHKLLSWFVAGGGRNAKGDSDSTVPVSLSGQGARETFPRGPRAPPGPRAFSLPSIPDAPSLSVLPLRTKPQAPVQPALAGAMSRPSGIQIEIDPPHDESDAVDDGLRSPTDHATPTLDDSTPNDDIEDLGNSFVTLTAEEEDTVQQGDHALRITESSPVSESSIDYSIEGGLHDRSLDADDDADAVGIAHVIALLNAPQSSPSKTAELPGSLNAAGLREVTDSKHRSHVLSLPYKHILEISIEGNCDSADGENRDSDDEQAGVPLGCYLVYRMSSSTITLTEEEAPSTAQNQATSSTIGDGWNSIWWDGDCAVLNGRTHHIFVLTGHETCFPRGLEFFVVRCDSEGGLLLDMASSTASPSLPPVSPDAILGSAVLPSNEFEAIISSPGTRFVSALEWDRLPGGRSKGIERVVNITFSHRIEPLSLRASANAAPINTTILLTGGNAPFTPAIPQATVVPASNARATLTPAPSTTVPAPRGTALSLSIDQILLRKKDAIAAGTSVYVAGSTLSLASHIHSRLDSTTVLPGSECFISSLYAIDTQPEESSSSLPAATLKISLNEAFNIVMPTYEDASVSESSPAIIAQSPKRALRGTAIGLSLYYRKSWRLNPQSDTGNGVQLGDYLIGTCRVDLSALSFSTPMPVDGWYHIEDALGVQIGQVRVRAECSHESDRGVNQVVAESARVDLVDSYSQPAPMQSLTELPVVTTTPSNTASLINTASSQNDDEAASDDESTLQYSKSSYDPTVISDAPAAPAPEPRPFSADYIHAATEASINIDSSVHAGPSAYLQEPDADLDLSELTEVDRTAEAILHYASHLHLAALRSPVATPSPGIFVSTPAVAPTSAASAQDEKYDSEPPSVENTDEDSRSLDETHRGDRSRQDIESEFGIEMTTLSQEEARDEDDKGIEMIEFEGRGEGCMGGHTVDISYTIINTTITTYPEPTATSFSTNQFGDGIALEADVEDEDEVNSSAYGDGDAAAVGRDEAWEIVEPNSVSVHEEEDSDEDWEMPSDSISGGSAPVCDDTSTVNSESSSDNEDDNVLLASSQREHSLKSGAKVTAMFQSLIQGVLSADVVKENFALSVALGQAAVGAVLAISDGVGRVPSSALLEQGEDWKVEERDDDTQYAQDFVSYQGTDTDNGSIYTLDFDIDSVNDDADRVQGRSDHWRAELMGLNGRDDSDSDSDSHEEDVAEDSSATIPAYRPFNPTAQAAPWSAATSIPMPLPVVDPLPIPGPGPAPIPPIQPPTTNDYPAPPSQSAVEITRVPSPPIASVPAFWKSEATAPMTEPSVTIDTSRIRAESIDADVDSPLTPLTSKIKNIVTKEVERLVPRQMAAALTQAGGGGTSAPLAATADASVQSVDGLDAPVYAPQPTPDRPIPPTGASTYASHTGSVPAESALLVQTPPSMQPTTQPTKAEPAPFYKKGAWSLPGFAGKLDQETERISKIMLGLHKKKPSEK